MGQMVALLELDGEEGHQLDQAGLRGNRERVIEEERDDAAKEREGAEGHEAPWATAELLEAQHGRWEVSHVGKPPAVVSFAEMWNFEYMLRHAQPAARGATASVAAVGDVWLAVGPLAEGGVPVRTGRSAASEVLPERLRAGALVRSVERDADCILYELLVGRGPESGWACTRSQGESHLVQVTEDSRVELGRESGCNAQAWAPAKPCRLPVGGTCLRCKCGIPLGGAACAGLGGEVIAVHAECMARLLRDAQSALCDQLERQEEEEEARQQEKLALRKSLEMECAYQEALRVEYGIGWREELVPCNEGPAQKLGCDLGPQGTCCLVVQEDIRAVEIAATDVPAVSVNLEYLSIVLEVGILEGMQPWFSLDPVDPADVWTMLSKRFSPNWLAGTSVGEVLFQSDYYLKDLSMGQFKQPVAGMMSCWHYIEASRLRADWDARIWFVVMDAEVNLSEDNVLIPHVVMGVEAREMVTGSYKDAPVTHPDHPLVRYAEAFTRDFDAVAERVSVVYYLRELAKASALAKFLVENRYRVEEPWLRLAAGPGSCRMEAPRLWNRRGAAAEGEAAAGSTKMLWGGVDLSLRRFSFSAPKRVSGRLSAAARASVTSPAPQGVLVY
mmetsp:Transcript_53953/g.173005  ORF Transcript_53953/g.173005 Transcript_53953/m.173005 type:complete len:616 (-) Transcript_53953:82-1929(-)